nr:zinc finger, CCHC-type [Tanacetum cinerariifolium]
MATAIKHMALNFAKLEKFKGVNFRRWQKKMHFLVSSMSVVYVLTTSMPEDGDFKHTLKHLKEELTLIELGSHLRIEESLRVQDSDKLKGNNVAGPSVVNMVEHNNSSRYDDNKGKRKHHDTKADPNKKPKDDDVAWWVDSGETVHVCKDRCWFKTYESLNDGSILHMRNESTTLVHGRGCVDLRLNIVCDNIGSAFMSTSKLNDSILWHARLGHVHFKKMQDMSKDGLIPAFNMDTEKCKTYMMTKITKKPFQNVKRKTKVLELIHSDLCDLYATPSFGNKKYFVTFIDDVSRFCYVYLLRTKDEALDKFKVFKTKVKLQQGSLIKRFRTDGEVTSVPRPSQRSLKDGTEDSGGTRDEIFDQHFYCFNVEDDLKTFDESMKSQDVAFWKEAINDEMDFIMGNNTWVLTDLPPGIDYFDTYALVARISTIRLLIAMASIHNLIIHQMDVKIAFLNGELEDEYTSNPGTQHWQAIQRVLKYLKKTMDYRLVYSGYPSVLEGYTDASWISNNEDNSSTSDWVFLLGGGAIFWASKKQTCITGSTMEFEFVALASVGKEAEWLKNLLF